MQTAGGAVMVSSGSNGRPLVGDGRLCEFFIVTPDLLCKSTPEGLVDKKFGLQALN